MYTSRSSSLSFSIRFAALAACTMLAGASAPAAESPAPAGTIRIEVEFFTDDRPEPSNRATVWTSKRRVRIEQRSSAAATAPVFLYRGDQDRLVSLSHGEKTYVSIERRLLELMSGRPAARDRRKARSEVDGQLDALPADQQRAFEHLLGGAAIDGKRPDEPLVVTHTEERSTVAGLPCRRVTLSHGRHLLAVGCIADWEAVGLTPDDVEVFRSLARLTHDAMGSRMPLPIELVPGQPLDLVVQFGGFPLSFERAGDVPGRSAIRVASVERIAADETLFEIPAGYAERPGFSGLAGLAGLFGGARGAGSGAGDSAPNFSPPAVPASPAALDAAAVSTSEAGALESAASASTSASTDALSAPPASPAPGPASTRRAPPATPGTWRTVPLRRSVSLFEDPE